MPLFIDNDVFCKLSLCDLLNDAVSQLNLEISACSRLPSLVHMLRRGSLRKSYGDSISNNLIPIAQSVSTLTTPSDYWLDKLVNITDIDPGEALIFASAAERESFLLTGDKRALFALKSISDISDALKGRIIVLEAILIALCDRLGEDEVRKRIQILKPFDIMVSICFSAGVTNSRKALNSYYSDSVNKLSPLELWKPN